MNRAPVLRRWSRAIRSAVVLFAGSMLLQPTFPAPGAPASVRGAGRGLSAGMSAPAFALPDTGGVSRSLSSYSGRPAALFFYCGCPWCHRCARLWGRMQRSGALDPSKAATLVVFQGDTAMARQFVAETALDPARTTVLPDPDLKVTFDKYDSAVCPRVFVVDPTGRIAYTNNHASDAPRKAPEALIVGNAVSALRRMTGTHS